MARRTTTTSVKTPPAPEAVSGPDEGISHAGELIAGVAPGYAAEIGMVLANDLYDLGDDNCGDNDKCHITSDDYDDGDTAATFSDTLRLNLRRWR